MLRSSHSGASARRGTAAGCSPPMSATSTALPAATTRLIMRGGARGRASMGCAGTWRRAGELRLEAVPVALDHVEIPWRAARCPQGFFVEGIAAAVQ